MAFLCLWLFWLNHLALLVISSLGYWWIVRKPISLQNFYFFLGWCHHPHMCHLAHPLFFFYFGSVCVSRLNAFLHPLKSHMYTCALSWAAISDLLEMVANLKGSSIIAKKNWWCLNSPRVLLFWGVQEGVEAQLANRTFAMLSRHFVNPGLSNCLSHP